MIKKNSYLEVAAVELCEIRPNHRVLEVGFGPGVGLKAALDKVHSKIKQINRFIVGFVLVGTVLDGIL